MAITLGSFTRFDNGAFTGTLKTRHVTAPVSMAPGGDCETPDVALAD